ncbi:hypothetical protein [Nocardioides sp. zg-1228]|uniref:hypothetical protein n=1 Tax=Nocardioides sp. zg-1228 TaxID=2763008 RepID=UPI0016425ED1|nr:hypothetical protein [Nocardioides sp. zg-1228]MBC2934204.1 hypothetical protein [Nocardioides sp. zg-1228]QSF58948.1 hypothetical protein JX575_07165 [Nocardioides sp. zg-1228]
MGARARLLALTLLVGLAPGAVASAASAPPQVVTARADDPPTRTITPMRLPRGSDARLDHMQDGVIHTAGGDTLSIRTPANGEQRMLLGESRMGWLVAVRKGYLGRVVAIRKGKAPQEVRHTRTTTYGQGDAAIGWLLSRDGEMLVSTTYDRGGGTSSVLTLAGDYLGGRYSSSYFTPFDADAGHIATWGEDKHYRLRVMDWVPRTSRTEIARNATWVSLRDDLMFVRTTGRLYGPSPISAPVEPAWAAPFSPLAISPDGETAVGLRISGSGFNSPAVLDVRRMSDGALLDSIAFGRRITEDSWSITSEHEQTAAWEGNRRFVFQLPARGGAVLVRCDLAQSCQRASDVGGNISFPHESFMWW